MLETYKLVGFLNLFGAVPDFVYPIFEKENKYYFLIRYDEKLDIKEFKELRSHEIKKINFLNNIKSNISDDIILTKESKPIFAFQSSYGYVHVGFLKEFRGFFETYEADNDLLKIFIDDFFSTIGTK